MTSHTVAIVGSFRQHYREILAARSTFIAAGIDTTTPRGDAVLNDGAQFVRFDSDAPSHSDELVQVLALHRIFRANAVYVVAPGGYVGRTTCYEIGRCMQATRPIYFSEPPEDLPVAVPSSHVATPAQLAAYILDGAVAPTLPLHDAELANYERRLLGGDYDEY